jgi:CRISPR-associated exonuclease Cas4
MDEPLPLSALQHYAFCPRQFALIHVEQMWAENRFTAEGRILHARVDAGEPERRGKVRFERGVSLLSHRYGLIGKMDLLEVEAGEPPSYRPIEYKRGKTKNEECDRIQLCAQAICLEEMRDCQVQEGAIWYWQTRRREPVIFSDRLRSLTIASADAAHQLLAQGLTPRPTEDKKRCRACSLNGLCQPEQFRKDRSARYVQALFRE